MPLINEIKKIKVVWWCQFLQKQFFPTCIMVRLEFWLCLVLSLASNILGERSECHWGTEYLCGDKCLLLQNQCRCGEETFSFKDSIDYICCNQGTCMNDWDGSVKCNNGSKQNWRVPCNGRCEQEGRYGITLLSCKDQKQCVKTLTVCRGVPVCSE